MAIIKSEQAEAAAVMSAAEQMLAAVRTAPKTRGLDDVTSLILTGSELQTLIVRMEDKYDTKGDGIRGAFKRDAGNVQGSAAVVLVGVRGAEPKKPENPLDCGACGYPTCAEFMAVDKIPGEDFSGPSCVWQLIDLGIALGSAVKTASMANIDNRMMYTIGAAAREMGIIEGDIVVGIPLTVSGKNIFFDR